MLLEEAIRVPLILRFPGKIPANKVITEHYASHMQLFATIMDYLDIDPAWVNYPDGKSLRGAIEGTAYNPNYDEVRLCDACI